MKKGSHMARRAKIKEKEQADMNLGPRDTSNRYGKEEESRRLKYNTTASSRASFLHTIPPA